jgi:hypothetical protein
MQRRILLLLTALIVAAMMSVGPAFAHGNHNDCRWDGDRGWHDHDNGDDCDDNNGDDDGDGGLGFLPGFIQNIIED